MVRRDYTKPKMEENDGEKETYERNKREKRTDVSNSN